MKLENQVTSLEISKRLKELGVKQESLFVWAEQQGNPKSNWFLICTDNEINEIGYDGYDDYASAFTVAELGEMLPETVSMLGNYYSLIIEKYTGSWNVRYEWTAGDKTDKDFFWEADITEANALGKMLIYLLENNLLKQI